MNSKFLNFLFFKVNYKILQIDLITITHWCWPSETIWWSNANIQVITNDKSEKQIKFKTSILPKKII